MPDTGKDSGPNVDESASEADLSLMDKMKCQAKAAREQHKKKTISLLCRGRSLGSQEVLSTLLKLLELALRISVINSKSSRRRQNPFTIRIMKPPPLRMPQTPAPSSTPPLSLRYVFC